MKLVERIALFCRLANLVNGQFLGATDATQYARWTNLRAACEAMPEKFCGDYYLPGVVGLIDQVAKSA